MRKFELHSEKKSVDISIIVPCYNEYEALPFFYKEITEVFRGMLYEYEILLIDDGSKDETLTLSKKIAQADPHVRYYSFSRNFGKEAAMYAGFCNTRGNYVAVMDADMQDPPDLLPRMIEILNGGQYDSVATYRTDREGEPFVRSFFAKLFYKIMNKVSEADIVDGARDFRIMKREMVDAIIAMGEINRFSKGIFGWIGFKTCWLEYNNVERVAGKTKWNFWKLFKYAIDGIINFSEVPLSVASWFGFSMTGISFILLMFIIVRKIAFGDPVAGWASTVCIIVFIGGLQLFFMGIIGQYIAKSYTESKKRPHYIISETNDNETKLIN